MALLTKQSASTVSTKTPRIKTGPTDEQLSTFSTVEGVKNWINFKTEDFPYQDLPNLNDFCKTFGEFVLVLLKGGKYTDPESRFPRQERINKAIEHLKTRTIIEGTEAGWRHKVRNHFLYNDANRPLLNREGTLLHPPGLSFIMEKDAAAKWIKNADQLKREHILPEVTAAEELFMQLARAHFGIEKGDKSPGPVKKHLGRDKTYHNMVVLENQHVTKEFCSAFIQLCPGCKETVEKSRRAHARRPRTGPTNLPSAFASATPDTPTPSATSPEAEGSRGQKRFAPLAHSDEDAEGETDDDAEPAAKRARLDSPVPQQDLVHNNAAPLIDAQLINAPSADTPFIDMRSLEDRFFDDRLFEVLSNALANEAAPNEAPPNEAQTPTTDNFFVPIDFDGPLQPLPQQHQQQQQVVQPEPNTISWLGQNELPTPFNNLTINDGFLGYNQNVWTPPPANIDVGLLQIGGPETWPSAVEQGGLYAIDEMIRNGSMNAGEGSFRDLWSPYSADNLWISKEFDETTFFG